MRRIAIAAAAALLAAACTAAPSASQDAQSPSGPSVAATTTAAASVSASPSVTVTASAADRLIETYYWKGLETVRRFTRDDFSFAGTYDIPEQAPAHMNADGTAGSGCHPPTGEALPDGLWAVYVVDFRKDALVVDLICSYHFDSHHYRDALEQNLICEYDDVNNNSRLRTVPLHRHAQLVLWNEDAVRARDFIAGGDPRLLAGNSLQDYWIYVNGGEVTQFWARYYC